MDAAGLDEFGVDEDQVVLKQFGQSVHANWVARDALNDCRARADVILASDFLRRDAISRDHVDALIQACSCAGAVDDALAAIAGLDVDVYRGAYQAMAKSMDLRFHELPRVRDHEADDGRISKAGGRRPPGQGGRSGHHDAVRQQTQRT